MTRDRLWTLLAVLLPVLGATIAPMSTVDLAYQVRVGDLMRASGSVLRADPLTFTAAGQAWLNQQWGAGVLLSLGYSAGGWAGLALLRALLVGLAVGLVFWTARRWLPVRPAVGVAPTLRIYWLQNWFNLLDAPTEEALYAMTSTREFVSIDLDHKPAPDEETTPRVNLHDYPVTKPSFCDGL